MKHQPMGTHASRVHRTCWTFAVLCAVWLTRAFSADGLTVTEVIEATFGTTNRGPLVVVFGSDWELKDVYGNSSASNLFSDYALHECVYSFGTNILYAGPRLSGDQAPRATLPRELVSKLVGSEQRIKFAARGIPFPVFLEIVNDMAEGVTITNAPGAFQGNALGSFRGAAFNVSILSKSTLNEQHIVELLELFVNVFQIEVTRHSESVWNLEPKVGVIDSISMRNLHKFANRDRDFPARTDGIAGSISWHVLPLKPPLPP